MELSSIDPKEWGPVFWKTIDYIISAYPEKAAEPLIHSTGLFFESLKAMLPCEDCRKHYKEFYDSNPIDLSSRSSLEEWVSRLRTSKSSNPGALKTSNGLRTPKSAAPKNKPKISPSFNSVGTRGSVTWQSKRSCCGEKS